MKYNISKTSDFWGYEGKPYSKSYQDENDKKWYVDIETLDELNAIIEETECQLVINTDSIEIYDDYRE
mgnify:CR=1 FL=1